MADELTPIEKKLDRRAARTRRALRLALTELILEKGYEAITVQEITDRADLNRGTLYLHYRDKQDLLMSSCDDVYNELLAQFTPISANNLNMNVPEHHLEIVFTHVASNADYYRVMLGDHGVPVFMERMRKLIAQVGLERLQALLNLRPGQGLPPDFVAGFIGGAIMGVLAWWIENDLPGSPEKMAAETLQLIVSGVYPTLGLADPFAGSTQST